MPSIPGEVKFLVMMIHVSVLFPNRRLIIEQTNKVEAEAKRHYAI